MRKLSQLRIYKACIVLVSRIHFIRCAITEKTYNIAMCLVRPLIVIAIVNTCLVIKLLIFKEEIDKLVGFYHGIHFKFLPILENRC